MGNHCVCSRIRRAIIDCSFDFKPYVATELPKTKSKCVGGLIRRPVTFRVGRVSTPLPLSCTFDHPIDV